LKATLSIRSMRSSDSEFIEELAERAFGEYSSRAARITLALARGPQALTLIACAGPLRTGFAVLELQNRRQAHLAAIAVSERYRGTGIGRSLLASVEREVAARKRVSLRLVTSQANLAAIDLFLKTGYKIETRLTRYYARGQDALLMSKRLRGV
jgi:ribosomal protein S18 acetylase RimI-like enzyme